MRDLQSQPIESLRGGAAEPLGEYTADPRARSAKSEARTFAESMPPKLRLNYARAFCAEVTAQYWSRLKRAPQASLRSPKFTTSTNIGKEARASALALAQIAADLDVDEAGYLIGSTYAAMLPTDFRSDHGVFYTPPAVVRRLLDSSTAAGVNWATCKVLDPACGGGAFLGPVARRMIAALGDCDRRVLVRNLAARLHGFEIDPFAAWLSLVFLDATMNNILGYTAGDQLNPIKVCDSLQESEPGDFDLVLGNPPYGRIKLDPELRETYKRSLYGHANLYGIFLDLAIRKARSSGGVIAYVTPTSFLCGEYYKSLRALLAKEASPVALDLLTERSGVFDDVLQETLLAVFRRAAPSASVRVSFVEVASRSLAITDGGCFNLPGQRDLPWIVPRSNAAVQLAARLSRMTSRLADWGYCVNTGPLVWNRYKGCLREKKDPAAIPLIWAECVSADGDFVFRASRRNHAPYFVPPEGEEFLLVRKPCVLLQRTTAKEQSRRLIAAELPLTFLDEHDAVTVENHLNMIVPTVPTPPVDTRAVAAFLNSGAADRVFRCISGTVAVSAYELESMPLPAVAAMRTLASITARKHSKEEIERCCDALYDGPR
jgi:adenine-specific DNA-methyltransferase